MIKGLPPASFEVIPYVQRNVAATSSSAERRGASGFRGGAAVRMGFPMRAGGRIELPQRHLTSTRLSSFKQKIILFLECECYVWCPTETRNNFMGNT